MIDANTTILSNRFEQLETNVINLAWNVFSTNNYVDDIYVDNFDDTTGINTGLSTYQYDTINKQIERVNPSTAITLVTNVWSSTWPNIKSSFCFIKITPSTTPTTDSLTVFISVDGGTIFYEYANLYNYFVLNNCNFLRGDISDLPTSGGRSVIIKLQTNNTNDIKINDISIGVSY